MARTRSEVDRSGQTIREIISLAFPPFIAHDSDFIEVSEAIVLGRQGERARCVTLETLAAVVVDPLATFSPTHPPRTPPVAYRGGQRLCIL